MNARKVIDDDITYIIFPNGGDWVAKAEEDPFLKE